MLAVYMQVQRKVRLTDDGATLCSDAGDLKAQKVKAVGIMRQSSKAGYRCKGRVAVVARRM
jgi:hypothetical protein